MARFYFFADGILDTRFLLTIKCRHPKIGLHSKTLSGMGMHLIHRHSFKTEFLKCGWDLENLEDNSDSHLNSVQPPPEAIKNSESNPSAKKYKGPPSTPHKKNNKTIKKWKYDWQVLHLLLRQQQSAVHRENSWEGSACLSKLTRPLNLSAVRVDNLGVAK